jgi:hypothetical protein
MTFSRRSEFTVREADLCLNISRPPVFPQVRYAVRRGARLVGKYSPCRNLARRGYGIVESGIWGLKKPVLPS